MRKKLFSVTRKDCRWDYYKGSGGGGQKKNKTENCCRCTHKASKAVGKSEEGRSKEHNRRMAFKRMAGTKVFKRWVTIEYSRMTGMLDQIKKRVEYEIKHQIRTEIKENGKWKIEVGELS